MQNILLIVFRSAVTLSMSKGCVLAFMIIILGVSIGHSQVQYGGVIRAKNNSLAIGEIKRTDDALKVNDSTLKVILDAINAKLPGNLTVTSTRLLVDASGTTQPISGTIAATQSGVWNITDISGTISLPTGAATAANQATGNSSLSSIDGKIPSGLTITSTRLLVDGSGVTQPVSGTFWQATQPVSIAGNQAVNVAQINGVTPLMGNGITGTGSQRVTIASDNTAFSVNAIQSGTWNIGSIATLPALAAGTNNIGDVDVLTLPALPAGTNNIGDVDVLTVPSDPFGANADAASATGSISAKLRFIAATGIPVTSLPTLANVTTVATLTNLSQMGGQAIAMGTGTRSAGTQRVTIATDDVVPASQSGTWTVQPGNTANTTPWLTASTPTTTGGLSTYHLVSGASTNATSVKASAGQLYGYYIFNANAAARKVAFHNTAGTPTAGASVFFSLVIPAGSGANVEFANGIAFSSGIGITTVTGTADSDATAVASGDLIINLYYK